MEGIPKLSQHSKSRCSIFKAILLSVCAGCVLSVHAEEPKKEDPHTGTVVYTVKAIAARTKLTSDMFREQVVSSSKIPQAAVSRIYELEGRIAQYDLPKDCLVSTPFASGLYAPKGDPDYKDLIPCIYDTSTNSWSIKPNLRRSNKKKKRPHKNPAPCRTDLVRNVQKR